MGGQWQGHVMGLCERESICLVFFSVCRARLQRVSLGGHATGGTLSLDGFLSFSKD